MNGPFVAENGPLLLRPMEEKDCADIVRWRNEERVRKWYIYRETFTQEGERDYFRNVVQTGKAHIFMICGKENPDRALGCCVINNIDESANEAESGLFIGEESALGKGYGSLALDACAAYAFKKWGYGRLTARVFTDNVPSLETHRKAGYAILKRLPGVVCTDADVRDMYLLERKNPSADSCRDLPAGEEEKNAGAEAAAGQDGKEMLVSFVIPCYHSEKTLAGVVDEIERTVPTLHACTAEIIMVNDNAPDACWTEIRRLCADHPEDRKGLCLSRNFGQHAALMAGIREAKGERVVCLDDDGQTPADEVGKLLDAIEQGADVVYASYGSGDRKQRSLFRNMGTSLNEHMAHSMLGKPKDLTVTSYFAMRRYVADEVLRYSNSYPYLIGLVLRTTTNIVNVPVTHRPRRQGSSGYTFGKLVSLWMNGFTAFSVKPLRAATAVGSVSAVAGFLYGIYTIVKKIVNPSVVLGFSSLMSAIVFFGGMTMLMVGMAGEYIGRMYIAVNEAPQYVVRETTAEGIKGDGSADA